MTGSNQFPLFLLQVFATVAMSFTAVQGLEYMMKTPSEPSTYTVTSSAPGHVGSAPVSETMQRGGMTPFVETTTISLDKDILAALKKTPLRQISVQAIGTSFFAYNMVFNGSIVPSVYPNIGGRESMYYLDISGDTRVCGSPSVPPKRGNPKPLPTLSTKTSNDLPLLLPAT